jgi:hypothetical protein
MRIATNIELIRGYRKYKNITKRNISNAILKTLSVVSVFPIP